MKTLEQLAREAGMVDQLNQGAASCVYSHGCNGVTQDHLERFRAACRAEALEEAAQRCEQELEATLAAQVGAVDDLANTMLRQVAHLGFGQAAEAIREMK